MRKVQCPNGCSVLEHLLTSKGPMWECVECKGRAVGVAVLRKAVQPQIVTDLWGKARAATATTGLACMYCTQSMARVSTTPGGVAREEVAVGEPTDTAKIEMDICTRCHVLWVDTNQIARMGEAPPPEEKPELFSTELPPEAKRAAAIHLATMSGYSSISEGGRTSEDNVDTAISVVEEMFWGIFD